MIDRLKPIPVVRFASHVAAMHHDRDKGFELEYQVRLLPAMMQECAVRMYSSDCVSVSTFDYFRKRFLHDCSMHLFRCCHSILTCLFAKVDGKVILWEF